MKSLAVFALLFAAAVHAQTTPPATAVPDDKPSYKVGAVLFGDYTYQQSPRIVDIDGNAVHPSSFNVTRAYINLTGQLNHRIAFRITPDIVRETGSGSSISGSQTFRLKFAYAQLNLDDWTTKGSWIRGGLHQTPFIDYTEQIYRYRFQGPIFVDREGFVSASDNGLSAHWNAPGDYGDVHAGIYNGETFTRAEPNNEKGFEIRGSVRPFPRGTALTKGLRFTAFAILDQYVESAARQRLVGQVTYEHPRLNAGVDVLRATDQASERLPEVDARGFSVWATPKLPHHLELLLRHDELRPNTSTSQKRRRNIAGLAYWVPNLDKVTAAVMADYESVDQRAFTPDRPDERRVGVKMLISF
ncbi:MAG TPA: hypothetical protein VF824_12170 [Thermoanaerobaculia bacterium]|jgi:hypothetical protein